MLPITIPTSSNTVSNSHYKRYEILKSTKHFKTFNWDDISWDDISLEKNPFDFMSKEKNIEYENKVYNTPQSHIIELPHINSCNCEMCTHSAQLAIQLSEIDEHYISIRT